MTTPSERFQKRKQRLADFNSSQEIRVLPSEEIIQEILSSTIDYNSVALAEAMMESHYHLDLSVEVSQSEITSLLNELRSEYNRHHASEMAEACKSSVMAAIIKPFGLSKFISQWDKDGGNVTTIHNANKGIYSKSEHVYDRQKQYVDKKTSDAMKDYRKAKMDVNFQITDEYTGNKLDDWKTETDHIVPLKEYHNNGGFMQNDAEKKAFAQDKDNFAVTEMSINRSKKDRSVSDFENHTINGENSVNKERYGVDDRRASPAEKRGKKAAEKHLPTSKEKAMFYTKESISTGGVEAAKMGFQQATGLLLMELTDGLWMEFVDIFKNGFYDGVEASTFIEVLRKRFTRVADKVVSRWQDVLKAFGAGAISGFLSNLVTFIINTFASTLKRINRIIREGVFSLAHAVKMVCFPPPGMTLKQAAHEATKLIATGLITALGLGIEEFVEKTLLTIPVLGQIASIISPVFVLIVGGLLTAAVVYLIDKCDLFGVVSEKRSEFVLDTLDCEIEQIWSSSQDIIQEYSS